MEIPRVKYMGYDMPERPAFLENALQGLAYWMGYRSAYFNSYPLPEAAIVTEACNLIQSNLASGQVLRPEVMYRKLVKQESSKTQDLTRVDLAILSKAAPDPYKENNVSDYVQFVIEVKRSSSTEASIDEDLRRLYQFKKSCSQDARALLILASEAQLPERFVGEAGVSRLYKHDIPNSEGCYHVRRTVKAAHSFKRKEHANYVCVVEVFTKPPQKLPKF